MDSQADIRTFRGYEVAWNTVIVYDDVMAAEDLANELGTDAKHASSKDAACWDTFSVVPLSK